jgi:uncharacterized membrane protein
MSSKPESQSSTALGHGMSEEEAFRRALADPKFRTYLLSEWEKSKSRSGYFLFGAIALFCATLLYTGFMFGRWSPNFLLAGLVLLALWMRSRANTSLAALHAMEPEESNQPPQPIRASSAGPLG